MVKKLCLLGLVAILLSALVFGCKAQTQAPTTAPAQPSPTATIPPKSTPAPTTPAPTAAPIALTWSAFWAPTYPILKYYLPAMTNEIEKKTGGRVKFTIAWAGALGKVAEQYNIIKTGLADMAEIFPPYSPGRFPLTDVGNLPFTGSVNNLNDAMTALMKKGYFDKEYDDVILLSFVPTVAYDILFKNAKPMKIEDFAGLKVRSIGGYLSDYVKSLGMVPVTIESVETYGALERGIIDTVLFDPTSLVGLKVQELKCKSFLNMEIGTSAPAIAFNKAKWATLPSDVQGIIRQVTLDFRKELRRANEEENSKALDILQKAGIEVYTLPTADVDKLKAAATPFWERFVTEQQSKGSKEIVKDFVAELKKLGENPPYTPKP